jgi:hypothetical protein
MSEVTPGGARALVEGRGEYEFGFSWDLATDKLPPGLDEGVVRYISARKQEPEWLLEWRLGRSARGRRWRSRTGPSSTTRPIDYQGVSYWAAPQQKKKLARRGRPRDPRDLREARHPAAGAGVARRRRAHHRRRRGRLGLGRHHVPRQARRARHRVLQLRRGGAGAPGPRARVPRHGRAAHRQLLRRAQLGRVLGRLVRVHPEGRQAARWSCPRTSASTPSQHRAVRADAAHRRRGRARELPRGLHRPDARREPAPRRRRRAGRHGTTGDHQVLDRAELVPRRQADGKGGVYNFVTKRGRARGRGRGSRGPRSRRARRSPGSTRRVSSRATARSASSTRWPCPTTGSRPTPAPR